MLARLLGEESLPLPATTMRGALCSYVCTENKDFQPMGSNMGILPPLEHHIKGKQERYQAIAERGLADLRQALAAESRG